MTPEGVCCEELWMDFKYASVAVVNPIDDNSGFNQDI